MKKVVIVIHSATNDGFGTAEICVDGKHVATVNDQKALVTWQLEFAAEHGFCEFGIVMI